MPVIPTYPGVYIEEIPSGVRTITGVSTSITAFIGRALKGPVNAPITINNFGDYERKFGGLWVDSTMSYAVRDFFLNGGSQAIIVRVYKEDSSSSPPEASTAIISLPTEGSPVETLILEGSNPGKWGRNLKASVNHDTKDKSDLNLFNLKVIEDKENGHIENFFNVSINSDDSRYLPRVLENSSTLVLVQKDNSGNWQVPNVRPAKTIEIESPPNSPPDEKESWIPAKGGNDGSPLTHDQYIGPGMQSRKEGLYLLEKADLFNLLCIPPYTDTKDVDNNVVTAAAKYCKERRAMLLLDSPSSWTNKDTAKNGIFDPEANIGTRSNYAALFFPRLKQSNPLRDNQIEEFVPCGAVAGVFARTDAQRGVWKAPAGQDANLAGVPELSVPLTDDENGELNQLGLNCLRSFPVYGRLIWGSRTLDGADRLASDWKYISVRRTALFIEESLYRGTQWVVFEPNDEPLWAQIRLNVGAFMHNLFRQGAFQGVTPKDAYLVKCDKETTTQNDINLGIVNILVGFAPLKPAEFVFIKIQQLTGQIEV